MQGFVGGRPDAVGAAGEQLRVVGTRVASVVPPYAAAARAGADATAPGPPALALTRCARVWEQALTALADQVEALGVVAQDGAADLAAAGGS